MKVLLINKVSHQTPLMLSVCNNMMRYNIEVDLFNFSSGLFYSAIQKKQSFLGIYRFARFSNRIKKIINRYLLEKIILHLGKRYDVIEFQGLFTNRYINIIPNIKKLGKQIKITIWGSDFYRQAGGTWKEMTCCYDNCDIIQIATEQMKKDFIQVYPQFENKIRLIHFGLSQLEVLKEMIDSHQPLDDSFLDITKDEIVLTCGYNGFPAQRHELMIKAILALPLEIRNRLYILFPMTYGTPTGYIEKIESLLQSQKIRYKIFSQRLSLKELMTLRIRTDIAINIQKTDAFAASIQEHIMAGNLLIVGEWLPYQILDEHGIFVKKSSIENLSANLQWAIENYQSLQPQRRENSKKMYELSSWNYVAKKWADIYNELS